MRQHGIRSLALFLLVIPGVQGATAHQRGEIIATNGLVQFVRSNALPLIATNGLPLEFGDRLLTGDGARATIRWQDQTKFQMRELTSLEILPPPQTNGWGIINLIRGAFYQSTREKLIEVLFKSAHVVGAVKSTEYEVRVESNATFVTLFEGVVELSNALGTNTIRSRQAARVETNQPPRIFTLESTNIVQWWLHYPAVLDITELQLTEAQRAKLRPSLEAYQTGDLRRAWNEFQRLGEAPVSAAERVYFAALRLTSGEVGSAERLLEGITNEPAVDGLRRLIHAVSGRGTTPTNDPVGVTGWLGESYLRQGKREGKQNISQAFEAAEHATALNTNFGFAWARQAELEFSRGNASEARRLLERATNASPSLASAHALHGFVLAAQNRMADARKAFEQARQLDPSLANAWLGLGLARFRSDDPEAGLADLHTAALLEPNRSLLHSYFGKGFSEVHDTNRAQAELALARRLDPNDPTPSLYLALEYYQENRVNEAIAALDESLALNDNRAVYRSELLLDQDRAVRATSLARIYERAGMPEVALREAARAVSYDYSSSSAHLFLADAFNALRDPTRFNLRYETAWFNEVLLANALSPVDAGIVSPTLSMQEYTRLFARDGFGLSSFGEARSDGQFRQLATQSGVFGRFAYAIDFDWQHNEGLRRNNDLDRTEVYPQVKVQMTEKDTALVMLKFQRYESGDNFQYLDPASARPAFRFREEQSPIAVGIWRHDWSPGIQTLALVGRLENDQRFGDRDVTNLVLYKDSDITADLPLDVRYRGRFEAYVGELNQILESDRNTLVFGARAQSGQFRTDDLLTGDPAISPAFGDTTGQGIFHKTSARADFSRTTVYAYDTVRPWRPLALTAGLAWDDLKRPANFRHPPVGEGSQTHSSLLPKFGAIWDATDRIRLRGMYAQSLGGVSLDESYRLEPVQLAGFSQAFRTVIPESLAGSVSGHELELGGLALDVKLPTRTYLGVEFTSTASDVTRQIGVFDFDISSQQGGVTATRERLRYEERAVLATVHQLLGQHWSVGMAYRYSEATLEDELPAVPFQSRGEAELHQCRLHATWNLAGGWFARAATSCWWQSSEGTGGLSHHETHEQTDVEVGWRFSRQYGELSGGVLNLFDQNYRLHPLSAVPELPRERVFFARLRLNF